MKSLSLFLDITKLLISRKTTLMLAEIKKVSRDLHSFGSPLGKVKLCHISSFQDMCGRFQGGGSFYLPLSLSSPEKAHPEQGQNIINLTVRTRTLLHFFFKNTTIFALLVCRAVANSPALVQNLLCLTLDSKSNQKCFNKCKNQNVFEKLTFTLSTR